MTDKHPITPPPELLDKWDNLPLSPREIFVLAAQWGADQELDACCGQVSWWLTSGASLSEIGLRAARRPEPPSLKEQSLALIDLIQGNEKVWNIRDLDVVRRALEKLND